MLQEERREEKANDSNVTVAVVTLFLCSFVYLLISCFSCICFSIQDKMSFLLEGTTYAGHPSVVCTANRVSMAVLERKEKEVVACPCG